MKFSIWDVEISEKIEAETKLSGMVQHISKIVTSLHSLYQKLYPLKHSSYASRDIAVSCDHVAHLITMGALVLTNASILAAQLSYEVQNLVSYLSTLQQYLMNISKGSHA